MAEEGPELAWRVEAADEGERLDRHAAARLDETRNQVQRWIRDGDILVDGAVVKPSHPVAAGERDRLPAAAGAGGGGVRARAGRAAAAVRGRRSGGHRQAGRPGGPPRRRPARTARWPTACSAGSPEIAAVGGPGRPGIVHRLDLDTTGVMVVARTPAAYRRLSEAFAERRVGKSYLAIAYGVPRPETGRIDRAARPPPARPQADGGARRRPAGGDRLPDAGQRPRPVGARADADHRPNPPDPRPPEGRRAPAGRRPGLRRGALARPVAGPPGGRSSASRGRRSTPGASSCEHPTTGEPMTLHRSAARGPAPSCGATGRPDRGLGRG